MPLYTFLNNDTGETQDYVLKISEYDNFVNDNPKLERIIKPIRTVSSMGDSFIKPTSNGFRDVLKRIKKASGKGNTVETF